MGTPEPAICSVVSATARSFSKPLHRALMAAVGTALFPTDGWASILVWRYVGGSIRADPTYPPCLNVALARNVLGFPGLQFAASVAK